MKFFWLVFATLFVIGFINFMDSLVTIYLKDDVYACSEVTKSDPPRVQAICKKAWRRYE